MAAAVGRSVAQLSLKSARFWVTFIDFLTLLGLSIRLNFLTSDYYLLLEQLI